jgi:hypothetical protein
MHPKDEGYAASVALRSYKILIQKKLFLFCSIARWARETGYSETLRRVKSQQPWIKLLQRRRCVALDFLSCSCPKSATRLSLFSPPGPVLILVFPFAGWKPVCFAVLHRPPFFPQTLASLLFESIHPDLCWCDPRRWLDYPELEDCNRPKGMFV